MYHIPDDRRSRRSAGLPLEGLDRLSRARPYARITVRALAEQALRADRVKPMVLLAFDLDLSMPTPTRVP